MKIVALLCTFLLCLSVAQAQVRLEVDERGVKSLKSNGREFVALDNDDQNWQFKGAHIESQSGGVATRDAASLIKRSFDAQARRAWFENGSVRISSTFSVRGNALEIDTSIENIGENIIRGAQVQLLTLRFPSTPANFNGDPRLHPNRDAPALIHAPSGDPKDDWQVLVENQTPARPLIWGFPYSIDKPQNRTYPLIISTRGVNWLGNLLDPYIDKPLLPGAIERIKIVLHMGTHEEIEKKRLQVLEEYAQRFPMLLKWDDRRPIGMVMLSSSEPQTHSKTNPRGWFNDPTLDIANGGDFKKRVLDRAREVVRVCKGANAQGAIVWDLEGQEFPHATSYLGDPRSLPPEIEALTDEFFQVLRDGGLKVGLCIRPQLPVRGAYESGVQQIEVSDPAQVLGDKIAYAKKRWGATLFYVDSNGDPNVPFPAQQFEQVLGAHPDVLLIPEHQSARTYRSGAPYDELRGGVTNTPDFIREIYPRSFSVIVVSDGDTKGKRQELVRAVKAGDVLVFRAWFDDSFIGDVKSIYQAARAPKATLKAVQK